MYRKSFCTSPGISIGGGVDVCGSIVVTKLFKLYVKVFHVMSKELSDELSCKQTGLAMFIVVPFS